MRMVLILGLLFHGDIIKEDWASVIYYTQQTLSSLSLYEACIVLQLT
jgi:hypothetical protein